MASGLRLCLDCAQLEQEDLNRRLSLKDEDDAVAKITTHPRVTLADIEANIVEKHLATGMQTTYEGERLSPDHPLRTFTICMLVLRNGFVVVGTSAAADPRNFDAEMGKKIAYEAALRQVWPLMGYELRERLHRENEPEGR